MLEGRVAAPCEGDIEADRVAEPVDSMFRGPLYRPGQLTFLLCAERLLAPSWEKNAVPDAQLGGAANAPREDAR
jgi:hypothetical protein